MLKWEDLVSHIKDLDFILYQWEAAGGTPLTVCFKRINLRTMDGSEPEGRLETGAEEKQHPKQRFCS